jgi:hypothetical protein
MAIWEFWQRTRWFGVVLIAAAAIEVLVTFVALWAPIPIGVIVRQVTGAG